MEQPSETPAPSAWGRSRRASSKPHAWHPVALAFWLARRPPGWRRRARIGPLGEFLRGLDHAGLEELRCQAGGPHVAVLARRRLPDPVAGDPAPSPLAEPRVSG